MCALPCVGQGGDGRRTANKFYISFSRFVFCSGLRKATLKLFYKYFRIQQISKYVYFRGLSILAIEEGHKNTGSQIGMGGISVYVYAPIYLFVCIYISVYTCAFIS